MEVAHYPDLDLPAGSRPVVTLGNFDGVHLGHQRAMELVNERARVLGSPAIAITFEPHPVSVLRPDVAPGRILTPEQKQEVVASFGLRWLLVIGFTRSFSRIEPEAFVREVLVDKLGVSELVLGENFRFGHDRAGDLDFLRAQGEVNGFAVHRVEPSLFQGEMISSSRIRRTLQAGRVEDAASMMGRAYFVDGAVVRGDGRGEKLGFPTANLQVEGDMLVDDGVYVSEARVADHLFRAMTHVGRRPTFAVDERAVETHLFDFSDEVYGSRVRLYFHRRIRGTIAFDSPEALRDQLEKDRATALAYFDDSGRNLVL